MNKSLASAAENGVHRGNFEQQKGFCGRFGRQATEVVYGEKYDEEWRGDGTNREATAAKAAHRFLAHGLGFLYADRAAHGGLQPGDIGFKTQVAPNRWGDFSGHVGILCMDLKRWSENSSTGIGRVRGALGFRTLAQWGTPDIIVRLPDPAAKIVAATPVVIAPAIPLIIDWNGNLFTMESLIERSGHIVEKVTEDLPRARVYVRSSPK